MIKLYRTAILFACCALFSSCFKDEPLNAECDIEEAYIHVDAPEEMFFNLTDTLIKVASDKNDIVFSVRKKADITALAPVFNITGGATISPASGSVQDFSKGPVIYKVTSQDGQWSRNYNVSFEPHTRTVADVIEYDFEHYALDAQKKYYVWNEVGEDGSEINNWATGNPGFRLSMGSAKPDEYPTTTVADGYDGACVKLETKSTGAFGAMVNMRLAAGNLFIGEFDVSSALKDAMQATQFGLPFDRKPLRFTGYYKYKAGATFQDKAGKPVAGKVDEGRIYSVLYRNHDAEGNAVVLHGNDVMTSPLIVAFADAGQITDTEGWTYFDVEFDYSYLFNNVKNILGEDSENLSEEEIEENFGEILNRLGFNLAVVFSSSDRGASFEGAVGSTLYVDKVRVECDKIEE